MINPAHREALAKILSDELGVPINITVRGNFNFTFSTDEVCADLEARVVKFFGILMELDGETLHDDETGSFVYMKVKGK